LRRIFLVDVLLIAIIIFCEELNAILGKFMYLCASPNNTGHKGDLIKYYG